MSLTITHQDSHYTETQSNNGVVSNVHYIIKNTPFKMNLLCSSPNIDFLIGSLSCVLLYDLPGRKKVESVSTKALEFVMTPSGDGKSASVQFRISVLSTQHHANFIVSCSLKNKAETLTVMSNPMKSCSKLEQIRRKIAEKEGKQNPPSKKKRARADELLETLQQIREAQNQQTELLANLSARMSPPSSPHSKSENTPSSPSPHLPLDTLLDQLLESLSSINESERPNKIRKITSNLSEEKAKLLASLGNVITPQNESPSLSNDEEIQVINDANKVEIFQPNDSYTEPLFFDSNALTIDGGHQHTSKCNTTCGYQKELENWNNVLQNFLTD